jgi:protein-disulfide isomerase
MRLCIFLRYWVASLCLAGACGSVHQRIDVEETPVMGDRHAPHVLVVYSDFECPYCKRTARALRRFVDVHPDRAVVYFKYFPLRQHIHSQRAAQAAEAARLQGKFWEMHDLIFSHAGGLDREIFVTFAADIGLDVDQFQKDWMSKAVLDRIASDRAEGDALGLWGTPFFILDGTPFNGRLEELLERMKQ